MTDAMLSIARVATRLHNIILAFFLLLFTLYSYPGFMSTDSVEQLLQARGSVPLTDWHPPLMALEWRFFDTIISGPVLMLLLQSIVLLFSLFIVFGRVVNRNLAALLAGMTLSYPPILATMAVIWKDSQMAAFAMAGIAALTSDRIPIKRFGIVLLTIAMLFRVNAAAAIFPLIATLWPRASSITWRRRLVVPALFIVILLVGRVATYAMNAQRTYPWHNSIALFDLVGMIKYARARNDDVFRLIEPAHPLFRDNLRERAKDIYYPRLQNYTVHGRRPVFALPVNEAEREGVFKAWLAMATNYPTSYLRHRWRVFRELIGFSEEEMLGSVYVDFCEDDAQASLLNYSRTRGNIQGVLNDLAYSLRNGTMFRPYVYLVIGFVLLMFLHSQHRTARALLLSGLLYECSFVIAAPSSDYRYSHWMIVCTCVAGLLIFISRLKRGLR